MGEIKIGCGSWSDPAYAGLLYPPGTPAAERLSHYATWFDLIEVNFGYYQVPARATLETWASATPPGFTFDYKLHRSLTTIRATGPDDKQVQRAERTRAALQPLVEAGKLGVLRWQMPHFYKAGPDKLSHFARYLELFPGFTIAVELRDPGWLSNEFRDATSAFYRKHGLIWIATDLPRHEKLMPPTDWVTGPLAYLRLQGRNLTGRLKGKTAAAKVEHAYTVEELAELRPRLQALADAAPGGLHLIAGNHARDFAPRTALALREMFGQF